MTSIKRKQPLPKYTAYDPTQVTFDNKLWSLGKYDFQTCRMYYKKALYDDKTTMTFSTPKNIRNVFDVVGEVVVFEKTTGNLTFKLGDFNDEVHNAELRKFADFLTQVDEQAKKHFCENAKKWGIKLGEKKTPENFWQPILKIGEGEDEEGNKFLYAPTFNGKVSLEGKYATRFFDSKANEKISINQENASNFIKRGTLFKNIRMSLPQIRISKKGAKLGVRIDQLQLDVKDVQDPDMPVFETEDSIEEVTIPKEAELVVDFEEAEAPEETIEAPKEEGDFVVDVSEGGSEEAPEESEVVDPEPPKPKRGRRPVKK